MAKLPNKDPLLDLSTLVDRDYVLIDSVRYEFRNKEELSILDVEYMSKTHKDLSSFLMKSEISDEDIDEIDKLSAQAVKSIFVELPDSVIANLTIYHRTKIIQVFTGLLTAMRLSGGARGLMREMTVHHGGT